MHGSMLLVCAMFCAQIPEAGVPGSVPAAAAPSMLTPPSPILPGANPAATTPSNFGMSEAAPAYPVTAEATAPGLAATPPNFAEPAPAVPQPVVQQFAEARALFESDHAFDGFTTPLSNPVQSKDPRSLTELRFLYMGNYSRPSTPVVGGGTAQVYAMQVRLALNERFQLFADKDGLVMLNPKGARSVFGMANINAGAKYVFIRDEESQFIFSGALQYEAPTGYSNIFEGHGNGLLAVYGIVGKQFWDNWHFISTFGQNSALNRSNSGY